MEKIALLPGGFKPPHAGHYNMAKWLASNTDADTVVVKVGAKERNGITREISLKLWDLYRISDPDPLAKKITILPSDSNSPVKDVYDFIEQEAPEGSTIYLGMGEKDANDKRFSNIGKFAEPKRITFKTALVPPQAGGVSGTEMRGFIKDNNKKLFQKYLPKHINKEQAWDIVSSIDELYNKPQSGEQPYGDTTRYKDHWKSSNLGNKPPVTPAYKYKRAGAYSAATGGAFGGRVYENIEKKYYLYLKEQGGTMTNQELRKHKRVLKRIKKALKKYDKQNRYFKVPKSWRGTLRRKLYENSTASTENGHLIPLEIMDTPELQIQGMMGRNKLKGGMLFTYNDVSKRNFHMKNCKIPLDIVFISNNEIGNIAHNCPPCNENECQEYSGRADNVLELPGGYCKKNNINVGDKMGLNINKLPKPLNELSDKEIKYFALHADILKQLNTPNFKSKYQELSQQLEGERLEALEYFYNEYLSKLDDNCEIKETKLFSKNWWLDLLTEGGAAGHMAHPFNLINVNSGKDLKNIFEKTAQSLQSNPGSVKIDGVNSSIRLIDLDGQKQFVMDRGSKKALDIKGITKADLEDRFKQGHGMVKVGGEVLDMFNEALPSIEADLKKLGAWDDPNILFNMEYVSGKTNVQDYGSNFIAIHGLNRMETKEVQGKRQMLTKRFSTEFNYDKPALQSLLDNLAPTAKEKGFEVYGSVPTKMKNNPNFGAALSKTYTIKSNKENKTQSLDKWLSELNDIPEKDFIFINVNGVKKKVGAVSKQVYINLLQGNNIDELFENEEDKQKAIEGFITYLATEKLGDEILKVLDSPMGSVENHEGVVIRDEKISKVPFKITGKFILGGMVSDF